MRDWARLVLWFAPPEWIESLQRGELELPTPWIDLESPLPEAALALGGAKVRYRAVSSIGLEVRVTPARPAKSIDVEIGFRR